MQNIKFNSLIDKGFSAIEMMVVLAVLVILATIAIPSSLHKIIKEQIITSIPLADIAKAPVAFAWATEKTMVKDNAQAGLPSPDKVVNNFISAVEIQDGAIHITFGNKAHKNIKDKVLTLRPAVIEESQIVPVAWVCGNASAPTNMTIRGVNKTDVQPEFLPNGCRDITAK